LDSSVIVTTARIPQSGGLTRRIRQLRLPWTPIFIMSVLVICAAFAPLLAPHDPTRINMLDSRIAPWQEFQYPLGTDIMGRDSSAG
jgi:peptide/nickel transport system permease protein